MAEKKDVAEVEGAAASQARKAYGDAMSVLRENHREEFEALLDGAYASLGLVSPRKRREEKAAAAAEEAAAKRLAREEKRLARIARLEAELAAARGVVEPVLEADPGDPIF